jgi:hypothetical protein
LIKVDGACRAAAQASLRVRYARPAATGRQEEDMNPDQVKAIRDSFVKVKLCQDEIAT